MPLIAKVGKKGFRVRSLVIGISVILWLGIALHLFPVWWMFTTSIKSARETFVFPPSFWPKETTFVAYKLFFTLGSIVWEQLNYPVYVYFKNSCIITFGTMIIQIPITALGAYSISKLSPPRLGRFLFLFLIGTMMIPAEAALIPKFLLVKHFPFPTMSIPKVPFANTSFPTYDFVNSYWAVILPGIYSAFNFILFKGFFDGIPDELINAARLDGASEMGIFRRIVLPVSKPVFAVVAYFTFSSVWNSFMWPLIVLKKNNLWPMSLMLYWFQTFIMERPPQGYSPEVQHLLQSGIGFSGLMAMSIIESIPVFIMFIIFREQLMTGIRLRGFK